MRWALIIAVAVALLATWLFTGPPCSRLGHLFDGRCDRLSLSPKDYPGQEQP